MDFSVKYTILPFTIVEVYTPVDETTLGHFTKNAQEPGGQFVNLDTVIVDVTDDLLTMYSCIAPLHITKAEEIIFASRSPTIDDDTLEAMKAVAKKQGLNWDENSL